MASLRLIATVTAIASACMLAVANTNRLTAQTSAALQSGQPGDARTAIPLSDDEAAFIRREMRGLLESVRDILEASATGDRARIVEAGRRAGMNGPESGHIPPSLAPKLPPEFKKLGLATHRGFDQIAQQADQGTAITAPSQLATVMNNCISCHATWRIVGQPR